MQRMQLAFKKGRISPPLFPAYITKQGQHRSRSLHTHTHGPFADAVCNSHLSCPVLYTYLRKANSLQTLSLSLILIHIDFGSWRKREREKPGAARTHTAAYKCSCALLHSCWKCVGAVSPRAGRGVAERRGRRRPFDSRRPTPGVESLGTTLDNLAASWGPPEDDSGCSSARAGEQRERDAI